MNGYYRFRSVTWYWVNQLLHLCERTSDSNRKKANIPFFLFTKSSEIIFFCSTKKKGKYVLVSHNVLYNGLRLRIANCLLRWFAIYYYVCEKKNNITTNKTSGSNNKIMTWHCTFNSSMECCISGVWLFRCNVMCFMYICSHEYESVFHGINLSQV